MKGLLFKDGARGVVSGFDWRPVSDYPKSLARDTVRHAKLLEADRVIVQTDPDRTQASIGLFRVEIADEKPPKELHSLSHLLLAARPHLLNAVVVWRYGNNKTAVVVIQGGMTVVDEIFSDEHAAESMVQKAMSGSFGFSDSALLTNDPGYNQVADIVTEEELLSCASKVTRLGNVPVNKILMGVLLLVAVVAVGGLSVGAKMKKDAQERARRAEMAKTDPVPPYQAALGEKIGQMGYTRGSVATLLSRLQLYSIWRKGWLLTQVECQAVTCVANWARKGGTTEDLVSSSPGETLVPKEGNNSDDRSTSFPSGLVATGLVAQADAVQIEPAVFALENTYQVWRNAKLTVEDGTEPFATWPSGTTGDVSRLPAEITLKIKKVEVKNVPSPLAQEIVQKAPNTLYWSGFVMKVSLDDKAQLITFTLRGNNYVR